MDPHDGERQFADNDDQKDHDQGISIYVLIFVEIDAGVDGLAERIFRLHQIFCGNDKFDSHPHRTDISLFQISRDQRQINIHQDLKIELTVQTVNIQQFTVDLTASFVDSFADQRDQDQRCPDQRDPVISSKDHDDDNQDQHRNRPQHDHQRPEQHIDKIAESLSQSNK